ncbi:hypothetical protein [Lysobacter capsici]|uniref:hypothetical protein n=1 Tax=Lysobacter capsici TaxID=435897 RepID=UPI00398D4BEC
MTGVALSPPTRPEGSPEPTRGCAQSGVWVAFPAAIVGVESPIFEAAGRRARARWMNAQARYLRACRTGTLLDARSAKNQATTMAAIASASRFQALRAASAGRHRATAIASDRQATKRRARGPAF